MAIDKQESTRDALAIMTEWLGDPGGSTTRVADLISKIAAERASTDLAEGFMHLVAGFINLTGQLLIQEHDATGRTEETILRELAARISG